MSTNALHSTLEIGTKPLSLTVSEIFKGPPIGNGIWGIKLPPVTHVRHVTQKGQPRDPNTLRAQYPENSWICYLATIANYCLVCCVAVRSAILATAWLLVRVKL